jgi:hypothetical protein
VGFGADFLKIYIAGQGVFDTLHVPLRETATVSEAKPDAISAGSAEINRKNFEVLVDSGSGSGMLLPPPQTGRGENAARDFKLISTLSRD